jgi:hypothetical protein
MDEDPADELADLVREWVERRGQALAERALGEALSEQTARASFSRSASGAGTLEVWVTIDGKSRTILAESLADAIEELEDLVWDETGDGGKAHGDADINPHAVFLAYRDLFRSLAERCEKNMTEAEALGWKDEAT